MLLENGSRSVRRLLDVDLRLLRIFRAIAEGQGLAGAELVLGLSPSRISAGLAELEARLGVRLCRRGRSGFALTEAGATVYEASHELFAAVDRFSNRAGAVADGVRRVLRLGAVDALVTNGELQLAQALRRFRRRLPSVQIDFLTAGPEDLERQLLGGSRDVVIVPSLSKRSELVYVPLFEERQSLYCSARHPLAHWAGNDVPASALAEHAFVARGYLHSEDLRRIGHRGAEATVETMEAQLILILSGEFIGYLPAHYADPWAEIGELRCLNEHAFSYGSPFFAVRTQAAFDNALVHGFLGVLAEAAAAAAPPDLGAI
jgi:LysR family transcriptional regulator, transcriptional activator for bauABCD operon